MGEKKFFKPTVIKITLVLIFLIFEVFRGFFISGCSGGSVSTICLIAKTVNNIIPTTYLLFPAYLLGNEIIKWATIVVIWPLAIYIIVCLIIYIFKKLKGKPKYKDGRD